MVYCACWTVRSSSHCGVRKDVCTRVVRLLSLVHFWFVVSLIKIIIRRSFVPPLPFVKPLEQLFSAISHRRAPSALGFVSNASRLVAQGTTYTHVLCACCKQCTLLCGFFRQNRNRSIVCSTTSLCKAIEAIIKCSCGALFIALKYHSLYRFLVMRYSLEKGKSYNSRLKLKRFTYTYSVLHLLLWPT